jgi:hypothetical protein
MRGRRMNRRGLGRKGRNIGMRGREEEEDEEYK